MNSWILNNQGQLKLEECGETIPPQGYVKVKITKRGITNFDLKVFKDFQFLTNPITMGMLAVGIVSEVSDDNCYLKRGDKVVISPNIPCGSCMNCKKEDYALCKNIKTMGMGCDGLFSDFAIVKTENLFALPDKITDEEGVFLPIISSAISLFDTIDFEKGDFIAIGGADTFGNILGQLALYYQAIPIMIDTNQEDLERSKKNGIYYNFLNDENLKRKVMQTSSGNMANVVIYSKPEYIEIKNCFEIIKKFGQIKLVETITTSETTEQIPLSLILKSHAKIEAVTATTGSFATAINLVATKKIIVSDLYTEEISFKDVGKYIENYNEENKSLKFITLIGD